VASYGSSWFHDGQLFAKLPDATAVYDIEQETGPLEDLPHVDWAWDEPLLHFLCELKDMESPWALEDVDGIETKIKQLADRQYLSYLARKAHHTGIQHAPSKRSPRVYVVVMAIEQLNAAVFDTAEQGMIRALGEMGEIVPTIVVNIDRWNKKLGPRTLERAQ